MGFLEFISGVFYKKTAPEIIDKKLEEIEKKFDKLESREKTQLKSELEEIIKRAEGLLEKL